MNNKLSVAFSSCPNDTFMFDAMIHQKIDTEGLEFEYHISDIEELNQQAFLHTFDITKLSFHAFLYLQRNYALLRSGSALGENVGPLLISKKTYSIQDMPTLHIAIPGKHTTANMLLNLTLPKCKKTSILVFSDIEEAVLNGIVDAGVIIHENRFTYLQKGLHKIADLGERWNQQQHKIIPLGGIVVKRTLPLPIQQKIERILKKSIEFAFENPLHSLAFVQQYAQNMDIDVIQKHIQLYVNEYSKMLNSTGEEAIRTLFKCAKEKGLISIYDETQLFV